MGRAFLALHLSICRKHPNWDVLVREMIGVRGVEQVIETVGSTLEQSIKSTALDWPINFIGRLSGRDSTIDTSVLYNSVATIRVIFAGNRDQFVAMTAPLR